MSILSIAIAWPSCSTSVSGAVNVTKKVPWDGTVGPVGDKGPREVVLQVVEPVAAGVPGSTGSGEGVSGEGGRVGEGERGLLQQLTEAGHLGGNVVGNEGLHVDAVLAVLHWERLREPLYKDLAVYSWKVQGWQKIN